MKPTQDDIVAAIKKVAAELGRGPSRSEFISKSGISEYHILTHFSSWNEAVRAAGIEPDETNIRVNDDELLADWAGTVRKNRLIPTRNQYRREGKFSPGVFEKHFGPWSSIPDAFRKFAANLPEWVDVLALIPATATIPAPSSPVVSSSADSGLSARTHAKLDDRPMYGDPIDFRGLRHAPVNEGGVVFLFGMVALELGYLVESVQAGFPDCEAKRQIGPNKWQRVRIEFEFESRNFRDHGHRSDACDIIICWRHNWPDCPTNLEVVELSSIIRSLSSSES